MALKIYQISLLFMRIIIWHRIQILTIDCKKPRSFFEKHAIEDIGDMNYKSISSNNPFEYIYSVEIDTGDFKVKCYMFLEISKRSTAILKNDNDKLIN